jgi:hypothetical protein
MSEGSLGLQFRIRFELKAKTTSGGCVTIRLLVADGDNRNRTAGPRIHQGPLNDLAGVEDRAVLYRMEACGRESRRCSCLPKDSRHLAFMNYLCLLYDFPIPLCVT